MTIAHNAGELFQAKYDQIKEEVPYNANWANKTGYYDHACEGKHAIELAVGKEVKAFDTATGRKLILIGTDLGPIVIFNRYTDKYDRIAIHGPYCLFKLLDIKEAAVGQSELERLVGSVSVPALFKNVGSRFKDVLAEATSIAFSAPLAIE